MPEGVEVKLSADLIKPLVTGKLLRKINIGNKSRYANDLPEGYKEFHDSFRDLSDIGYMVSECRISEIGVRGKFMYWKFSNGWCMLNTFGMSGQWSPKVGKHMCLEIQLYDDKPLSPIYFNDPRHFGTVKFVNSYDQLNLKLSDLGWDPLQMSLDKNLDWIISKLKNNKKSIGEVLMDQHIFAGVGNYIRAEALYLSKLSPWRSSQSLSKDETLLLCKDIVSVMEESYKHQGATILTYKTVYGEEGKYSSCFKVYGQKRDPLGNSIIKEKDSSGRTIHWCPTIQK